MALSHLDLKARVLAWHAARERQRAIYSELMKFAVEELGLPQAAAAKTNVVDYLQGFLSGKGIKFGKEEGGAS